MSSSAVNRIDMLLRVCVERNASDLTALSITAGDDHVIAFANGTNHPQGQARRLSVVGVHCHDYVLRVGSFYCFQQPAAHRFGQAFVAVVVKRNDRVARSV